MNHCLLDQDVPDIGVQPLIPTPSSFYSFQNYKEKYKLIKNRISKILAKHSTSIADWILNKKIKTKKIVYLQKYKIL